MWVSSHGASALNDITFGSLRISKQDLPPKFHFTWELETTPASLTPCSLTSYDRYVAICLPLGFSEHREQQPLLFGLFLGMYLVTMLGNLLIIVAIGSDQHLHTPIQSLFKQDPSLTSLPSKEIRNQTRISDFLLLGFSEHPEQQPLLFGLFLGMYLVTVLGNLLIILAIGTDHHLHTPMYFFLANLSFIDTCFSCTIVPKLLVNIQTQDHTISHTGCLVQMYFFIALALIDDFLLAVMAYDRYVAICLPLHYTTIICPQRCVLLVTTSWLCSHILAFSLTLLMSQFSFCASHSIPHFFCDLLPLLKLTCSDTHAFQIMMFAEAALSGVVPLTCVLVSYAHIIHTILRVPSAGGKHKVFSTCGSHLSVVTLFYGTLSLVYYQPSSSYSADTGMVASVIYTMVTPMLNPFIYSLRNRDMKGALWRLFGWRKYSTQ
ncbi:olfactory receptor-like protein OLF4 [Pteropus vampyrus]|uniref:Olfactory receptor-like protein OLF4 n=2 Tax=Pteropus vampyrus TaxID=132908 RepID=A0A6P3QM14_PTEVA|nr:olfactory receptor-like protein OLF4 [Pteropus vampyrus]